jgi:hypothetical protein
MNKKLVSLALASSLVMGSMSLGFAAGELTASIEDKDVVSAVERLAAFGIIDGMDDGKYHPELDVTREQFAKVLVEALGLGSAAGAAQGATQFADVEAGRWSSGYVNVAVGQGILKGYPDGTFKPANKVTYAEAVTMLVRALGYQDSFLSGTWPGNYVAKSADLGITEDVTFASDGFADRGSMAVMVNNTLDAEVVKVKEFGDIITYEESEDSLLEDKLDVDKYENLRFVKNSRLDDSLDSDEIVFIATKNDTELLNAEEDVDGEFASIEVDGVDTEALLGQKVKVYVNDDDEVVYMESDGTDKVVVDMIDAVDGDEITLYGLDDDYTLAETEEDTYAFVAGIDEDDKIADIEDVLDGDDADELLGSLGRFVVSGDEIVFADVIKPEATTNTGLVVTDIDEDAMEITGIIGTEGTPDDEFVIDLEDDFDEMIIVDAKTREVLSFEDISVNDVVYVAKQDIEGDEYAIVHVVRNNVVEGELGRYKEDEVRIGGENYDLSVVGEGNVFATFSPNGNDDVYGYADKFAADEDLEDVYGEDVTAITDVVGRVLHFTTDVEAVSETLYGVVDKVYDDGERARIFVATQDDLITYDVEDEDDAEDLEHGDFVSFKLNKDGEIAEDELELVDADVYTVDDEFGDDTIKTEEGTTFSVDEDDTVFINAPEVDGLTIDDEDYDVEEVELVNWADISGDEVDPGTKFVAFTDENEELEAVLFVEGLEAAEDEEAVYIVDTFRQNGDKAAELDFYSTGVEELVLDSKTDDLAKDEMVAVVKKQADGEVEIIAYIDEDGVVQGDSDDFTLESGKVTKKDGDFIYLNGTAYKLTSNTVVYEEDDKKSRSNITKGDYVDLVLEDGKNVRVAEILDEERTAAPVITLEGDAEMTLTVGDDFTDPGFTATDAEDGDLTDDVVVTGTVDTETAGTYTITYTVEDSDENETTATRTVIVEEAAITATLDEGYEFFTGTEGGGVGLFSGTVSATGVNLDDLVIVVDGPLLGAVTIEIDGDGNFTSTNDFMGLNDTVFTYEIKDGDTVVGSGTLAKTL